MSYDDNNVFAKILRGEIPCKKIYEDEFVLSFYEKKNSCIGYSKRKVCGS